jgi:hypothetical protein
VNDRIEEIREFFERKISMLNQNDDDMKIIGMLVLLDCLAQHYAQYPTKRTQEAFVGFVIEFSKSKWAFWEWVDPVTLYYHLSLSDIPLLGTPTLQCVSDSCIHTPYDSGFKENADILLHLIMDSQTREVMRAKHQYARLLYKMRSKIIHELNKPFPLFSRTEVEYNGRLPFYYSMGGGLENATHGERIRQRSTTWHLVFPPEFIELVLRECVKNYLEHCLLHELDPFVHNSPCRKFYLSWYDS